jgi:hypothetical protein
MTICRTQSSTRRNVQLAALEAPPWFAPGPPNDAEAALDIEMAQAMAPGAKLLVFEGSLGITNHGDALLHAMATWTPSLTTASSSWSFGRNDNTQQAVDEMAAQGASYFVYSGDFGDIGDPQDTRDLNNQTLVGGTQLSTVSTTPLLASLPPPVVYPNNYYSGDLTWNAASALQQKAVTGGGIMDGNNKNGSGDGGGPVPIPSYQIGVSMATNGGSTQFRNFPDVALLANNIEIVFNGNPIIVGGTSAAAPLWAGFMALVNQNSQKNGFEPKSGFVNPALYFIGKTRGSSNDLYSVCFNDVNDNASNFDGFGPGFRSVGGYDLTTGFGTPTCQLINQLSTYPPNTSLTKIEFVVGTGDDNLRGNGGVFSCGTGATADVLLKDGSSFTVTLHDENDNNEWSNFSVHVVDADVPNINPPLTVLNGIAGIRINIQEHFSGTCTADNWDISSLNVALFTPPGPKVCQLNLKGTSQLQDGSFGLVRLSASAGSSGVGPSSTFMVSSGSGCP